jgi:hypothetical protein
MGIVSLLLDVLLIAAVAGGAFLIMKALRDGAEEQAAIAASTSSEQESFRAHVMVAAEQLISETDTIIGEYIRLRQAIIQEDLHAAVAQAQELKGAVMALEAGRERVMNWFTPACTLHNKTDKLANIKGMYNEYVGATMLRLSKAIDQSAKELELADQGRTSNLLSEAGDSPLTLLDKSLGGLLLNGDHEGKVLEKSNIHTLPAAQRRFLTAVARELDLR